MRSTTHEESPVSAEMAASLFGHAVATLAAIRALARSVPDAETFLERLEDETESALALLLPQTCPEAAVDAFRAVVRGVNAVVAEPRGAEVEP